MAKRIAVAALLPAALLLLCTGLLALRPAQVTAPSLVVRQLLTGDPACAPAMSDGYAATIRWRDADPALAGCDSTFGVCGSAGDVASEVVKGSRAIVRLAGGVAPVTVTLTRDGTSWRVEHAAPALPPEDVTRRFYAWYLRYARDHNSPAVSGAYRDSDLLTADFEQHVDLTLASFSGGGYDPFLLAQDLPESVEVVATRIIGDRATVILASSFPGHRIRVDLAAGDGLWRIDNITFASTR